VGTGPAAARWRELQQGRGIPPEILVRAPRSPWRHDPKDFGAPAQADDTPSRRVALELLGPGGGTVMDVGCGGGVASLALVPPATELTGVDHNPGMLAAFAADCEHRGVRYQTVEGAWPEIAPKAGTADVVVCHHVGHNTVELAPFLAALGAAARRGVVFEMLAEHPMAWLDPLWLQFHDLRRPPSATVDDAIAVLAEIGVTPTVTRWERGARHRRTPEAVAHWLCLPLERADEVAAALADLPQRQRQVATLRWPGTA
jgi:SAM-dependent methyltransferase